MRRRLVASAVALVTSAGAVLTGAAPSSAGIARIDYVALGDSYSAASGVLPPDPEAPVQCLRSIRNYPHVIAERLGGIPRVSLTDVTCGAAQTKDFFESQHDGVAPQLDALSRRTDLVTMTIGGNDSNVFIGAIASCGVAGLTTAGQGSPCKDQYGDSFVQTVRTTTYPALVKSLRAVHKRAPRAEVAIIGYPWILPKKDGCFDKMPVATGDVPYLRNLQWELNDAIRRAAKVTGSTYVNMNKVSDGHDACQPIGVRWVEPVLQTLNPVVVHPNALGEAKMAKRAMKKLGLG